MQIKTSTKSVVQISIEDFVAAFKRVGVPIVAPQKITVTVKDGSGSSVEALFPMIVSWDTDETEDIKPKVLRDKSATINTSDIRDPNIRANN